MILYYVKIKPNIGMTFETSKFNCPSVSSKLQLSTRSIVNEKFLVSCSTSNRRRVWSWPTSSNQIIWLTLALQPRVFERKYFDLGHRYFYLIILSMKTRRFTNGYLNYFSSTPVIEFIQIIHSHWKSFSVFKLSRFIRV